MLQSYRITKYDPNKRDKNGFYIDSNEWTDISDFWKNDICEYLEIEDLYADIAKKILMFNNINSFTVSKVEHRWNYKDINNISISKEVYDRITEGGTFYVDELDSLIRSVLRWSQWFKIKWKRNFFIHFWYDLYMYIWFNYSKKIIEKISNINTNKIFIEEFRSPYLKS